LIFITTAPRLKAVLGVLGGKKHVSAFSAAKVQLTDLSTDKNRFYLV